MPTLATAHARGKLEADDLPALAAADDLGVIPASSRRSSARPDGAVRRGGGARLLWSAVVAAQPRVFCACIAAGWTFLVCMFVDPLLTQALLSEAAADSARLSRALALLALLSLNMVVRVTCMELCYFNSVRCASNARSILVMAVFRAVLAPPAPASAAWRDVPGGVAGGERDDAPRRAPPPSRSPPRASAR